MKEIGNSAPAARKPGSPSSGQGAAAKESGRLPGGPQVWMVAELSANHGRDIDIVKRSIEKAAEIGCDAVKIQTYTPDTITLDCDNEYFRLSTGTIWDGMTLHRLYSEAYLPWEWHRELFRTARETGITLFSSPFDPTAVDLLEDCGCPVYKIASFEINDLPLIRYAAGKGRPMILSTGIATREEIAAAVDACRSAGSGEIYLLQCTSQYPARIEDANLRTMTDMGERFGTGVGLSDHTEGPEAAAAAAALGAQIIEKHFTLDRGIGGPDASFSMEPEDFRAMNRMVRRIEAALGSVDYSLSAARQAARRYARSLFVVADVRRGDPVTAENVRSIRPAAGLAPSCYEEVLGQRFAVDVRAGTPLSLSLLSGSKAAEESERGGE
ncbi:MAG: pseudaminic acid synthase [Anaerovoracaceae bacterium]|jgi:pseudaminic acid synthase